MENKGVGYKVFSGFNILLMLMIAAAMLYPYLHVVAKAFNDGRDTMFGGITIFPRVPTLENFEMVLKDGKVTYAAMRTVLIVLIASLYELQS